MNKPSGHQPWATLSGGLLGGLIAFIWAIVWPYRGLDHDAQLYALQALNRLKPELFQSDLFFRFGSQDDFTIFTSWIAGFMSVLSVEHAAAAVTFLSVAFLAVAAWVLAKRLSSSSLAWMAVALLLVLPGYYGGNTVFKLVESFLTARVIGEAAVLAAFAFFAAGHRRSALIVVLLAHLLHPLMAFPGLLILTLMMLRPSRLRPVLLAGTVAGLLALVSISLLPSAERLLVDETWLGSIRQRSVFLFLDQWDFQDWNRISVAVSSLAIAGLYLPSEVGRRFARCSLAVGLVGLALTAVTSFWLPIEVLLKGQPWRWLWVTTAMAILLLPGSIVGLWTQYGRQSAPLCILLVAAWLLTDVAGLALSIATVFAAWAVHSGHAPRIVLSGALIVGAIALVWLMASVWTAASHPIGLGREGLLLERARDVLGLGGPAILLIIGVWLIHTHASGAVAACGLTLVLIVGGLTFGLQTFSGWTAQTYGPSQYRAFAIWRETIPRGTEVLWLDEPVAVWLLLERPSYLSRSQSAGIVFSPLTAALVRTRAASLAPLVDPGWLLGPRTQVDEKKQDPVGGLGPDVLAAVCRDASLGYVVGDAADGSKMSPLQCPKTGVLIYLHDCGEYR